MYWMKQMVSVTAVFIIELREKFSRENQETLWKKSIFNLFRGEKKKLSLSYEKDCTKEEFRDKIKKKTEKKDIKNKDYQ